MRNDARPMGEANPHAISDQPHHDVRDSVTHDRQSHVVNEGAAENAGRDEESDARKRRLDSCRPRRGSN